jgi:hypothetical protein
VNFLLILSVQKSPLGAVGNFVDGVVKAENEPAVTT